ncbi:MAG: tetratricopeptide repeat protein [Acidobacteriota bacterium]
MRVGQHAAGATALWLVSALPLVAEDLGAEARALVASYRAGQLTSPAALAEVAAALVELGGDDPAYFHDALRAYDKAIAAAPDNLDLQVELGDFFLAKYNGTDALATFEQVLERDPEHPGALVGLAEVRRFEGAADVSDLLEKALAKDPSQVAARLLLARQFLDLEDFPAAEKEVERALGVAPGSSKAHALLAAAALLAGDETALQRRLESAARTAEDRSEVFAVLAEVAARSRLYGRAVELADRAIGLDSKNWRGWALRGVNRLRLGDIESGRQDLETAFAGDPFDVWTKNTLDLLDTMAAYRVFETPRFQIVAPAEEAELLELYLGPLAEEAFDALAQHYGTAPPTPIRLEVFARHADFSVRTVGLVGLGALGVSFGPVIALDSPASRPAGEFHWGAVLWHELAHSFHMHASAGRVPRWFTEGLSVFEERRSRDGWGDRVDPDFLVAYLKGRLAPVEDLNQGFMRPDYPQQIIFSYTQASLVFDTIVERWGFDGILAMLEGYRQGESTEEVIRSALGLELKDLAATHDEAFRRRFAGPLAALEIDDVDAPPSLEALRQQADGNPRDFLAHLATGQGLIEHDPEAALPYLAQARDLFPAYAGPDSPYWLLAQIHLQAGRNAAAAEELRALVERNRGHYQGLRALAEIEAEGADVPAAVDALASAQYVYPYAEADHRQLALWYERLAQSTDAVRERRAVLALDPFNRSEALYLLARAQLNAGDRGAARRSVLEALEQAPSYADALDLLLELRGDRGAS